MSQAQSVTEFRVRYSETDQMGTFYNSRALEWFECGRTELLRAMGVPYAEMERRGVLLPLVESHVAYHGRARYDDLLRVTTTAAMAGKARVRFNVQIVLAEGERPVAGGHTVHAIVSPDLRPIRPPAWFLEAIAPPSRRTVSEPMERTLLSGNEAVALAARHLHFAFGAGYPGTPSTEILERFSELGGRAEWAPNEKVALEVALGAAFGGARAMATMKHVGLNVAADPLFTAAYTGVSGALVVVSADDPGMASSQNEQDNRRYAVAAAVPMLEPADSQEAYDFLFHAVEISERWGIPVLYRLTTRVCHAKTIVQPRGEATPPRSAHFVRDIRGRVMVPSNARPAHVRLRKKLAEIAAWNENSPLNVVVPGGRKLGIVASGAAYQHAREATSGAAFLKLGMTHPLPLEKIRRFAASVDRLQVIEEGDPYLAESLAAAGIAVAGKPEVFRFGELDVARVRKILAGDATPEPQPPPGKPPQLCPGCPHRAVFGVLARLGCIVAGDIGCYTLGVLPPFEAMDSCVCMGASIGVGLGLRHVLPPEEARKVVSVIGDSTFVHSGITGLVEMVYNPPATGHVVLILDNGTTAMTGLQEHPGTGRTLDHQPTRQLVVEDLARAMGIPNVQVLDPTKDPAVFERVLTEALASGQLSLIVARRPCLLAAKRIRDSQPKEAQK